MYMVNTHITLDLEPEVSTTDRERVLRAVRDRLKQTFGHRITVRTDEEASLWVVWLDDSYSRLHDRLEKVLERVESAGQARVLDHTEQFFAWFNGKFSETGTDFEDLSAEGDESASGEFMPTRPGFLTASGSHNSFNKTIIYSHDDESEHSSALGRNDRRQVRIPTRK